MKTFTISIENVDRLQTVENMSSLVNDLLNTHFEGVKLASMSPEDIKHVKKLNEELASLEKQLEKYGFK